MALALFVAAGLCEADGQISPGPLSRAHRSLEGLERCTQCHALGTRATRQRCMDCHTEIRDGMAAGTGYHASVKGHECSECHSEHQGEKFDLVRFDTSSFNHATTRFRLEGAHRRVACMQCHAGRRPPVRRERATSYLGLQTACRSCHDDVHRAQFAQECTACHTTERWRPAPGFLHERTGFRLTGKHSAVACAGCHPRVQGAAAVIRFAGVAHDRCTDCHRDQHQGKFPGPCERCHTTNGWNEGATRGFNHALTRFRLQGKHAAVACERCHTPEKRPAGGTRFAVARFGSCTECHKDVHAGQFARSGQGGACERCHTVDGFRPAVFSADMHQRTSFPLTGDHAAVPCASCHTATVINGGSVRRYAWNVLPGCVGCHRDVHIGQFRVLASDDCARCHSTEGWAGARLDHNATGFPLKGKHATVPCSGCHGPLPVAAGGTAAAAGRGRKYAGTPRRCEECHGERSMNP